MFVNRFECNNRIKFAVQQERIANQSLLEKQRIELLEIFRRDRDDLIETNNIHIESEVKLAVEQEHKSMIDKIEELNDRIVLLGSVIEVGKQRVIDKVEYVEFKYKKKYFFSFFNRI